jgi:ubiquitin carboxyl-terminal hydrolase 8
MTTPKDDNFSIIVSYTPSDFERLPKGSGKGLQNLSNTCYMNSAIQSFVHTWPLALAFRDRIYEVDIDEKSSERFLVQAFKMLIDSYYDDDTKVLRPKTLHNIINLLAKERHLSLYQLGNQNDIHEFIQFVIDSLHQALKRNIKATIRGTVRSNLDRLTLNGHKQWASFYRKEYSIIVSLFHGQYISTVTCPDCKHNSTSYTPECCFTLPIPSTKGKKPVTLIDCWRKFVEPEVMDKDNQYTCEKCKDKKQATKCISLWKLPEVLIVLLKRFKSHGHHTTKIDDMVTYPFELDMSEFCYSYDKLKSTYDLYSVCIHQGITGGGHYFAYCLDTDGKWRKYNDSLVSEIPDLNTVITKDAYCLFYRRKKQES